MNKAEITRAIADKSGLTVKDSERFLKAFTEIVEKALSKGENVALIGFGTFSVVARCARVARNFRTGKAIQVPESKTVRFKVGKGLKDSVNCSKWVHFLVSPASLIAAVTKHVLKAIGIIQNEIWYYFFLPVCTKNFRYLSSFEVSTPMLSL